MNTTSIIKLANQFYKLASSEYFNYMKSIENSNDNTPIHAWMVDFECGEEDASKNQWGASYDAWGAWRRWMKKRGIWQNYLNNSYSEFKAGYEKALILNKGFGSTQDPDDHEIWEEPHFPWGENRSRIRQKLF